MKVLFISFVRIVKAIAAMLYTKKQFKKIGSYPKPDYSVNRPYANEFFESITTIFKLKVVKLNDIPKKNALWVGNHMSWMDIPVFGAIAPVSFLAKAEIASWPLFGKLATAGGTLYIKRGSGDSGTVKDQIAEFLRNDMSVFFFPEATTTDGKKIKKIYGKLLQASLDTGVEIQPMVMCYINSDGELDESVPHLGNQSMLENIRQLIASKDVTAYVLALDAIEPTGHDMDSVTELLKQRLDDGLADLHSRVITTKKAA